MEEYVPIITPRIIAKEKPFKISPPRINIENKANKVVTEVIRVLDKVSFIERLEISLISILEYFDKFSLIRSYMTTVSFIEYPTIVNTAAIIDKFISRDKIEKMPNVIITSWKSAIIEPKLNCHSNLTQI